MKREVALPTEFRSRLGLPHGHDYHMVDVRLKDGRRFLGVPVAHEAVILGTKASGDPIDLNFETDDIAEVRRARLNIKTIFGFW
jgi:hypothetical protein